MVHTEHVITVYSFHTYEEGYERPRVAPYKATRAAIEREPGCQLIEGTAEQVDRAEIDADGRFRRVPTGWGDLDALQ